MVTKSEIPPAGQGSLIARHLQTLDHVVDSVVRRRALTPDDRDELWSYAIEKLVERERRVFAGFRGLATWRTYLERIVERLWIDLANARWGRWRPTAKARRLGSTVIELDSLVRRDRLDPAAAVATVVARRPHRSPADLAPLAQQMAQQPRPVAVPLERLEVAAGPVQETDEQERETLAATLVAATREALDRLGDAERHVLRLRFLQGLRAPEIARLTGLAQPEVYRRIYAGLEQLARELEGRGLGRDVVRAVTSSDGAAVIPAGSLDGSRG